MESDLLIRVSVNKQPMHRDVLRGAMAAIKVDASPPDATAGEIRRRLTSERRKALAVSADYKRAVILSEADGLLLWDVLRNAVVAPLEGHRAPRPGSAHGHRASRDRHRHGRSAPPREQ